jgi:hypothetical protein
VTRGLGFSPKDLGAKRGSIAIELATIFNAALLDEL